jgi:hypothetical protein
VLCALRTSHHLFAAQFAVLMGAQIFCGFASPHSFSCLLPCKKLLTCCSLLKHAAFSTNHDARSQQDRPGIEREPVEPHIVLQQVRLSLLATLHACYQSIECCLTEMEHHNHTHTANICSQYSRGDDLMYLVRVIDNCPKPPFTGT